ncbi:M24 family metallopeptidase [Pseudalkalibacillus caeni]|uniref:Aminopeptidase P family protein n=1 Tax=Exobacillus caeni TaxID=2574798 RepID=A0A5R9EWB5_9BACL|nr:Xaa-Pro peptidase family protein [Pseudalkalibacillus caeni]TLS34929.1 aminopeptidase P family protein [Pseudalkalibacillus caeni]
MDRLDRVAAWLKENNHSFAFIHSTPNVFYLSGFYTDPHERLLGMFVFPEKEPFLVCPGMEESQARDAGWKFEIIGYSDSDNPWELIQEAINKRGIKETSSVAIEKELLSYERAEQLMKLFPGLRFASVEDKLNQMRLIKDSKELEMMKEAAKLADFGVETGVKALYEGCTEMEVLAKIEYELKKKGVREMSFSTMVLFGEKAGQPHGNPGDRKLKRGDLVLFDLGVVLNGYTSDITRTFAYKEANNKQKEIYETVLKAQLASLEKCKEGTRLGDLDKTARDIISDGGYGDYFPHRIGHGIGIDVHEFPSMSQNNNGTLQKGMTFTIEPGIYVPEIGGVRIEDEIVITDSGYKTLTSYPKELQIIG